MTRPALPPLTERPDVPLDKIWFGAFPAYFTSMFCYGVFAALAPIASVVTVAGETTAQWFGAVIAVVSVVNVLGSLRSIARDRPRLELAAGVTFLVLMAVYAVNIYLSEVVDPDGATRPGSMFVPIIFSVFPFVRVLVIVRSGRLRKAR